MVGEKATISSQRAVKELFKRSGTGTRQIAASLREASQVQDLAGVDVLTIPIQVARAAREELPGQFESRVQSEYQVRLSQDVDEKAVGIRKLWEVTEKEKKFVKRISSEVPESAEDFIAQAHEAGLKDLFPRLSHEELAAIAGDGKIPKHKRWEDRIKRQQAAVDSLINLAGLASFTESQRELDDRVRKLISQ
jgi:transaldolase